MASIAILSQSSFLLALVLFAFGAVGCLLAHKNDQVANWWGYAFAILGSIFGLVSAVSVVVYGGSFSISWPSALPLLSYTLDVDRLSAFFIFIISLISILSAVYGLGYAKHFFRKYDIGALGFFFNAFIGGMLLVVSAGNAFFFLIAWEIMSLASYFLVIYENKEKENIKAGFLYFVMTHIGTAFIVMAFLLLYGSTGSLDFNVIRDGIGNVPPLTRNLVFLLALVGFGTKAGIIPLHIWLPSAHPAAPTHVSALMSGVMIKTGIYMMMRLFVDVMPDPPLWWGAAILAIGSVSALLGVLYALTEHDIKRLLAYHSIENIGIILLGLGSGLVFLALGMKTLAILGFLAALFHTLNHAIFKALLFMGAGSVISSTHTRNMEEYGGLIRNMPQTAFLFLVGAMAISALPPFNGFFSEWATFQALFAGIRALDFSIRWIFVLAAGSLAFTGGLAAACFVKAFGVMFLARPRSEEAKHAKESRVSMRFGMGVLALLTLVVGFFAGKVSNIILEIITDLGAFQTTPPPFSASLKSFALIDGFATVSMPAVLAGLVLVGAAVALFVHLSAGKRKVKIARTWDCGTDLNPRMEMTATGFSRSIIMIFKGILKPTNQTEIAYRDANMRYFPQSRHFLTATEDIYRTYLYRPLVSSVSAISEQVKRIQSGNLNAYVLYMFLILVVLLLQA